MNNRHDDPPPQQTSEALGTEAEFDDLAGILKVGEARRLTQGKRPWGLSDDGGGACSYYIPVI